MNIDADSVLSSSWDAPSVRGFFETNRNSIKGFYGGEWHFLRPLLVEGLSVLDIGCALGGVASALGEYLDSFSYTGIDVAPKMIERAKEIHPTHRFLTIPECDFSSLNGEKYDLVLCLGILHLHYRWRETLNLAWGHTKKNLIFDLRETHLPTVEDKDRSSFNMNFNGQDDGHKSFSLPYIIVNSSEAAKFCYEIKPMPRTLEQVAAFAPVSHAAQTTQEKVWMKTWHMAL